VQIDLYLSADLTNWFRPWWLRTNSPSAPSDPPDSIRERFNTVLPGTNSWFVRSSVTLIEAGPETANYYVATNGNDSNSGASNAPYATLGKAVSVANPGNLIYVRGGNYVTTTKVQITRNGTPASPIRLRAFPGEKPVFDFSGQAFSSSNRGIELKAAWWHVFGLEIFGAGDNGLNISSNFNTIELCVFHDCRDTGLQISTSSGSFPSSNLVINCDSYRNFDTDTHGENADGFAPKLAGLGPGNTFRGCRAWDNADDGWDLFAAPSYVVIENCWSWGNGSNVVNDPAYSGDGNGFKVGGDFIPSSNYVANCVSFKNTHHGFDQNNNAAGQALDNNTAWANGTISGRNFDMNHGPVTVGFHVLRNNLSIVGTIATNSTAVQVSNSWSVVTSPSTSDVLSTDQAYALFPRRDDGGLPETPFLRPVPNGRLVNKGANIGNPFNGSGPDLGAFETPQW
jgi:hypothetical protein